MPLQSASFATNDTSVTGNGLSALVLSNAKAEKALRLVLSAKYPTINISNIIHGDNIIETNQKL